MNVFEEVTIGNLTVHNRIGVPPMCTYLCETHDGVANDFHTAHYTTLAMGQPGFITQEATAVNVHGHISQNCLGIYNPRQREMLKRIVDNVHHCGTKIGIQLNHAGFKNQFGNERFGPMDAAGVIGLNLEQIQAIVRDFEYAAMWARELNYDFIEIHGAHGYLINQFLSPLSNQRDDPYGQNRTLLLEQITEVCVKMFEGCVGVRLSVEEYEPNGLHMQDFPPIINRLKVLGAAMISVSSGGLNQSPVYSYPLYQLPYAKYLKEHTDLPIMGVGLITTEDEIERILEKRECDLVLLGRKLLRDPFFLLRWRDRLGTLTQEDVPEYLYRGIHTRS